MRMFCFLHRPAQDGGIFRSTATWQKAQSLEHEVIPRITSEAIPESAEKKDRVKIPKVTAKITKLFYLGYHKPSPFLLLLLKATLKGTSRKIIQKKLKVFYHQIIVYFSSSAGSDPDRM